MTLKDQKTIAKVFREQLTSIPDDQESECRATLIRTIRYIAQDFFAFLPPQKARILQWCGLDRKGMTRHHSTHLASVMKRSSRMKRIDWILLAATVVLLAAASFIAQYT